LVPQNCGTCSSNWGSPFPPPRLKIENRALVITTVAVSYIWSSPAPFRSFLTKRFFGQTNAYLFNLARSTLICFIFVARWRFFRYNGNVTVYPIQVRAHKHIRVRDTGGPASFQVFSFVIIFYFFVHLMSDSVQFT